MPRALTLMTRRTWLVVGVIATVSAGFICSFRAFAVTILLFFLALAVFVALFLLFFETSNVLVKCGATKVVRVKSTVLLCPLNAGSDFIIRIRNLYCRLQVSDDRTQGIDATALVAFLLVAIVLDASNDFFAELHVILLA